MKFEMVVYEYFAMGQVPGSSSLKNRMGGALIANSRYKVFDL
jgi:hypothetical protein